MYTVRYEAFYGHVENFGIFSTEFDAFNWAKSDADYNVENAKKNGIAYKYEIANNKITIPEYGTWYVEKITPVG